MELDVQQEGQLMWIEDFKDKFDFDLIFLLSFAEFNFNFKLRLSDEDDNEIQWLANKWLEKIWIDASILSRLYSSDTFAVLGPVTLLISLVVCPVCITILVD